MNHSPLSRRALLLALLSTVTFAARAQHVGVGTFTPSERLDVVGGNLKISTAGSRLIFPDGTSQSTGASGTGFVLNGTSPQAGANFNISGDGTLGNNLQVKNNLQVNNNLAVDGAAANAGTIGNALRFGGFTGEGIGSQRTVGGNQYGLDFYTSSANRMSITGGGNVGLGTSTPGTRLEVVGGGGGGIDLRVNGRLQTGDATNAGGVWVNSANSQFLGQFDATKLGFFNNGWRMVVDNGGNVGIGTATPNYKLEVNGSTGIDGANTLEFGAGVAGKEVNAGKIGYGTFSSGASLDIVGAGTANNNRVVRVFAEGGTSFNGNVGIGTTAPSAALDVNGGARLRGLTTAGVVVTNASGNLSASATTSVLTSLASAQKGTATLGSGAVGVNVYAISFPVAFGAAPGQVLCTVRTENGQSYNDTFVVTTKNITPTGFRVNVQRTDANTAWGQTLLLDWLALP